MLFLRKEDGNRIPTVSGSIGVLGTPTNLNSPVSGSLNTHVLQLKDFNL